MSDRSSRDVLPPPRSALRGFVVALLTSGLVATVSATAWFWTGSHGVAAVAGIICLVVAVRALRSRTRSVARHAWLRVHAGEVYFVASGRRGWREFIENNVVPVLPPNVLLEWSLPRIPRTELSGHAPAEVARPFVMRVEPGGENVYSLNVALRHLKQKFPMAHPEAQREVAKHLTRFVDDSHG